MDLGCCSGIIVMTCPFLTIYYYLLLQCVTEKALFS